MEFLQRIINRRPYNSQDDYDQLIDDEKALPRPPRSTRFVPFKAAHVARLQQEARQRVELLADRYCGLPHVYLSEEELSYFRCT